MMQRRGYRTWLQGHRDAPHPDTSYHRQDIHGIGDLR
jgi:hypothetical protein